MGWQDQDLRHHGRPEAVGRARRHAGPGAAVAEQCQRQRGRADAEHRYAGGGGPRGGPGALDGRRAGHHGRRQPGPARALAGPGHRHRGPPASAGYRRAGPGRRPRRRDRADAARGRKQAHHRAGEGRDRPHQRQRHAAAGRAAGEDLRPQRPDRPDHAHRAAQHAGGDRADLPAAMGLPGQSAQRVDRGRDDSPSHWPSRSASWFCGANRPTCCRWGPSTSA